MKKLGLSVCGIALLAAGCTANVTEENVGASEQGIVAECGDGDEVAPVEIAAEQLDVGREFIRTHQGAVGLYNNSCSGVLITSELFLTAAHCVPEPVGPISQKNVLFVYQNDPTGVPRARTGSPALEVVEKINGDVPGSTSGADYAILRIANPGAYLGYAAIATEDVAINTPLVMIGHPDAGPKQVATGANVGSSGPFWDLNIDASTGSAGSPIFGPDGKLSSLFFRLACESGGSNASIKISQLLSISPILRNLAANPLPPPPIPPAPPEPFVIEGESFVAGAGVTLNGGRTAVKSSGAGSWAQYTSVDLWRGQGTIKFLMSSVRGGQVAVRLGSPLGSIIAYAEIEVTGSFREYEDVTVRYLSPPGLQTLYVTWQGATQRAGDIDSMEFTAF